MTTLGDAWQKALDKKQNDLSNFIWKGEKRKEGNKYVQDSIRMIDMSPGQLRQCYDRCELMLNNTNPKKLGRYNVLEEVRDQINKCNVELLLRYYENSYKHDENRKAIPRSALYIDLRDIKSNNPSIEDWHDVLITEFSKLPAEFNKINVEDVVDGCISNIDAFDKVHLTMTFITKMGLWFTKAEENELKGETNSHIERVKIAKERLRLPSSLVLRYSERGLSYHEMRAMLNLPKKQRYKDMTTEQLVTLRDLVLPKFLKEVDGHIFSWNRLKKQIELVAKSKGVNLYD